MLSISSQNVIYNVKGYISNHYAAKFEKSDVWSG